jgi:hypothetical protein
LSDFRRRVKENNQFDYWKQFDQVPTPADNDGTPCPKLIKLIAG